MTQRGRGMVVGWLLTLILLAFSFIMVAHSQTSETAVANISVPRLVNYSGRVSDATGKPITGIAGVTFSIYKDQYEGSPLWIETQSVRTDVKGGYIVQLGAGKPEGLPLELFISGEARWLGVRINNSEEQPRVLLLSVPYALKAADAQTLGGLPPSAFMLAAPARVTTAVDTSASTPATPGIPPPGSISGSGSVGFVPLFTGAATIGNSALFQSGISSNAKVGINTTAPAATLDVKGTVTIRGPVALPAGAPATASAGKNSQSLNFTASAFSGNSSTAVAQTFRWQAEPAGNNTNSPRGTMNLLFGTGASAPSETGLKIAHSGQITFAPGQTFPGTGTVTSVGLSAPAGDFSVNGSPVTKQGILGLHWKIAPTASDTANAIVKRDGSGNFSGTVITARNVTASSPTGAALVGQSSGTSGGSDGVHGVTSSASASGVAGVNTGDGIGVYGTGGIGLYGTSSTQQAIWGETFATGFANGSGPDGVHGVTHSADGAGVGGLNTAGGVGIWGEAPGGVGFYTPNNVRQDRAAGGWVKAMVYVNGYTAPYNIIRCYNSTLVGPDATTPPCGISLAEIGQGVWILDFGFQINDRFVSATAGSGGGN